MNNSSKQTGRIRKFNPGIFQSDEEVIRQFVVRKRELDGVLEILSNNMNSQSCQHVLLVAPRGRGKTMLLARVAAELRTNADFSGQLLPVRFMEESHEIFDLGDFWLEALFYLSRDRKLEPAITSELRDVHAALAAGNQGGEIEQRARAAVLETADRLGKKLVLIVENLQALCRDTDGDFGWKLRKVLQSEPQIILLASATSRFSELDDVDHAFFELFRIMHLKALDTEECRQLWVMVTGSKVRESVIRPLQILTGGEPRLLIIIGEFAHHQSLRQLMEDLVRLIDDHTEYFRSHLEGIAKSERRVYLALIDIWQPSSSGEIAARARMDIRTVSTMLGRLVDKGVIIAEGNGKKRYVSTQRLYSIYYKLRRERDDAAVVRNLIQFMTIFYNDDELQGMAGKFLQEANQSKIIHDGIFRALADMPNFRCIFRDEELQSISLTTDRISISNYKNIKHGIIELVDKVGSSQQDRDIEKREQGTAYKRKSFQHQSKKYMLQELFEKLVEHWENKEYETTISIAEKIVTFFGDSVVPEIQVNVGLALLFKGISQGELGETKNEIATYDQVIKSIDGSDIPEIQVCIALVLFSKGISQGKVGEAKSEIATYDQIIKRFEGSDVPKIQVWVSMSLLSKGISQGQLGNVQAEISTYDQLIEQFGDSDNQEIQVQVIKALHRKGVAKGRLGDAQAKIVTHENIINRFEDSDDPEIQVHVATALFFKGLTQGQLGDTQGQITTYDDLISRFDGSDDPEIQFWIATALFVKGVAQHQFDDAQKIITTYNKAVDQLGSRNKPVNQAQVAFSLINKAVTEIQLNRVDEAFHSCEEIERRCDLTGNLKVLKRLFLWVKIITLFLLKKNLAAMEIFRSLYAMYDNNDDAMINELLDLVPSMIASGASESDLIPVLSSDNKKANKLIPLVVALRQRSGEIVRAPVEVIETAKDIQEKIESRIKSGDNAT